MKTIKLHANLHCGSCEGKIKAVLKNKAEEVQVNVASGLIKVKYDESKIELSKIKELIQGLGYELS